jgi:cob(I)alamin adenosyltransferase
LGLARAFCQNEFVTREILNVQKDLIVLMGELATAPEDLERYVKDGFKLTTSAMVDRLAGVIVDLEKDKSLYPKDWVIPGKSSVSAALDLARAICRRAERSVVALKDLCWILGRFTEKKSEPPSP